MDGSLGDMYVRWFLIFLTVVFLAGSCTGACVVKTYSHVKIEVK
jgi:hypothetical protein